jgi:hypothetical protein
MERQSESVHDHKNINDAVVLFNGWNMQLCVCVMFKQGVIATRFFMFKAFNDPTKLNRYYDRNGHTCWQEQKQRQKPQGRQQSGLASSLF